MSHIYLDNEAVVSDYVYMNPLSDATEVAEGVGISHRTAEDTLERLVEDRTVIRYGRVYVHENS